MHQTEIRRPRTGLCRGSDPTDSGSEESQQLPPALCLRHLTLVGGEEEATAEGEVAGPSEVPATTYPSLWHPSASLPKHSSLALKLADSTSSLSALKRDRTASCSTDWTFLRPKLWSQFISTERRCHKRTRCIRLHLYGCPQYSRTLSLYWTGYRDNNKAFRVGLRAQAGRERVPLRSQRSTWPGMPVPGLKTNSKFIFGNVNKPFSVFLEALKQMKSDVAPLAAV